MKKWHLVIDVEKCENCNNCFLSCRDEYVDNAWPGYSAPQLPHGHKWININGNERGQYPFIDVSYLPVPCMHCDNAPCVKTAENQAIYKRPDGIVIIDPIKAKGQNKLLKACPYGAILWNEELKLPQKCTLCAHLLDDGWSKTRCVQSCPTGALGLLHVEEAEMQEIIKAEKLETYHPEYNTNSSVYYRNLYRFTRCFIGGSAAMKVNGKDECAKGAKVTLLNSAHEEVAQTITDNYGDFKFDNLVENSGKYIIQIVHDKYGTKTLDVELKKSIFLGIIRLD